MAPNLVSRIAHPRRTFTFIVWPTWFSPLSSAQLARLTQLGPPKSKTSARITRLDTLGSDRSTLTNRVGSIGSAHSARSSLLGSPGLTLSARHNRLGSIGSPPLARSSLLGSPVSTISAQTNRLGLISHSARPTQVALLGSAQSTRLNQGHSLRSSMLGPLGSILSKWSSLFGLPGSTILA